MANPAAASLQHAYPWTKSPLVTNAPMAMIAGPKLVTEVTRAGGLGFVAGGYDVKAAGKILQEAGQLIADLPNNGLPQPGTALPVGLGVLCFANKLEDLIVVLNEHRPVAVWLFGAKEFSDYAEWATAIRQASKAAIWIQTNSVTEALDLAKTVKPDVLVLQGADAGGHGAARGAGIVSLVPEAVDSLTAGGFQHIPVIAAGGVVDARGTAAALTLGASGVTMGTRFLASEEAVIAHKGYQTAVLNARDGGQSTVKCTVFDDVGPNGNRWPVSYDGRALRNASSRDLEQGTDILESRKLHVEALKAGGGWADSTDDSRANGWAGTGVGLVNTVEKAATIVENAREGAIKIIAGLATRS